MKFILLTAVVLAAAPMVTLCQTVPGQTDARNAVAQEVLKTEREQREA